MRFSNFTISAIAILMLAFTAVSCDNKEETGGTQALVVSPTAISIDGEGGRSSISVLSGEDWLVRSSQNWVSFSQSSGKASQTATNVEVLASANPTKEARTATITVRTLSGETVDVALSQGAGSDQPVSGSGIASADDLMALADAVNNGKSLSRFMVDGDIKLTADIDASSIKEWIPIGTALTPFTGTFDGGRHKIYNVNWSVDAGKYPYSGLIGYARSGKIRNLTFGNDGDCVTVTGTNSAEAAAGAICGYADAVTFSTCTNNADVKLTGDAVDGKYFGIGGICGCIANGCTVGGSTTVPCVNNGDITTGRISNTGNGSTGVQIGGIIGYVMSTGSDCGIGACTNNGRISAPAGRGGGITGTFAKGTMSGCTNNGLVEDDAIGQYSGNKSAYNFKRMGGISGSTGASAKIDNCTNNGNVISYSGCRAGGLVSHSEGIVSNCTNNGCIIGDASVNGHGPAWGCAYNKTPANFTGNIGKGRVGFFSTFGSMPESAPASTYYNAVYAPENGYDPETNTTDPTLDAYYDWTVLKSTDLPGGVKYMSCQFNNVPRRMHVLEIDLTNPGIEIATAYADDCVPNPNGNNNANNGFNLRETLSQLCNRKRSEGQNIIAGINTGFFDSNDGISRGFQVEECEPVYINNPKVVSSLSNHAWAFTVFTDRTASCEKKTFSGKIKAGDTEFSYSSVNDTILRHTTSAYQINLYTSRYKQCPHPEKPALTNKLAADALYVIAEYTGDPMKVNQGYADAKVTAIHDGRTTHLTSLPYITSTKQVGIALSGAQASSFLSKVSVGATISLRCDITVGGSTKPVFSQVSTMYKLMTDGKDDSSSPGPNASLYSTYDPMTFPVVSQDGKKVWLVEVDGRQQWFSIGVKGYEMYRIAKKLGGWNVTRMDGGGSSTVWIYDQAAGKGSVVNSVCDSKGERSCLNYIILRAK